MTMSKSKKYAISSQCQSLVSLELSKATMNFHVRGELGTLAATFNDSNHAQNSEILQISKENLPGVSLEL
jgi:hypothetical protein